VQACAFLESRGSPSYFDEIYAPTDHLNYFRWAIYPGICEAHGCNGDFFWLKDGKIYRSPKELARHYYAVYDSNPNIREKKINLVNDLETDFSVIFR